MKPPKIEIIGHERAEEALRAREKQLRFVSDHAPVFIAHCDHERRYKFVNQPYAEMFGLRPADIIGRHSRDVLGEEAYAQASPHMDAVLAGQPTECDVVLPVTPIGRRTVRASYVPERDASGRVVGFIAAILDITERKRAEEEIQDLSKFPSENPNPVLRIARDGTLLYINEAGLSLLPQWHLEVGHASPPLLREAVFQSVDNGSTQVLDLEHGERVYSFFVAPIVAARYANLYGREVTEGKRAEQALKESETKYRNLIEQTWDAIFVVDQGGKIQVVNERACLMLGYTQAELAQFNIADTYPAEERAALAERIAKAQRGEHLRYERSIVRKDGTTFPVEVAIGMLPNGLIQGIVHDITERKRAEEALRNRESMLQKIFDILPVGLWFADKDGKLLRGNPAGVKIWGAEPRVSLSELGVFKARRLPSGEDVAPDDGALAHTIRDKVTIVDELLEIDAFDGKKKTILNYTAPVLDAQGDVQGAIVVNQDITDRKRAEEALRESESRYRTLFEQSPDAVVVLDPQTTLPVDFNDEACRRLGYSREEFARLRIADYEADHTPAAIQASIREILAKGTAAFEVRHRTKQGDVRNIWISVRVLETGGQTVCYSISRDITERKRAEERMRTFSHEIITAREEERKQVSSVLHHDVGSLAVGVSAHLDAIEEDLRSRKPREALKWTKRTRKLFDKSVARLKEVAVQLRPPELDVLGLCAALRQHFSQVTKHGNTRIHFRETLGRRRVSGDTATTLFRVAQETLTNAITHGDAKQVDVFLSASKKAVKLTVRDNGKGFSPSGQTGQATSRMGLRVMKEMAASSGGGFEIHSRRGKGTTVRVSLPFKTAALGPEDVTVRRETVAPGKTTRSAGRGSRPQKGSGA